MASKKDSWHTFKEKMKQKRGKKERATETNKGVNKGEMILRNSELVIQRLSSEVSGKAQKYSRIGPREFVAFEEDELNIPAVKKACETHYKSLTAQGLECDVLAGDQGPSCSSIEHIPDLKIIHVRFIKREIKREAVTNPRPLKDLDSERENARLLSEPIRVTDSPRKRKATSSHGSSPGPKKAFPKSLTVSQMIKLGKLIKPSGTCKTVVIDIFSFDFDTLSWSVLPKKVEFTIENKVLGQGGFRKAFKASSSTHGFDGQTWVVKRFLEDVIHDITADLGQSMEDHTKKVIQMHQLSKNFTDQLAKIVKEKNVGEQFGPVLQFEVVYFGKMVDTGECVTVE